MRCIIVDDEPIARKGIKKLVEQIGGLDLLGSFNSAALADDFLKTNDVDLILLDINMPGMNGLEFAKDIPKHTLLIFTTAYSEYALDSYEVEAIDYLVKPIDSTRFRKAINKAMTYHSLLMDIGKDEKSVESIESSYILVKAERRFFKINIPDILFIEGLKDYVIIQKEQQRIVTRMTIRNIQDLLPPAIFLRVNRSFLVNKQHIDSFDSNDVFIKEYEIALGNTYRDSFFTDMMQNG